jgi:hypothetical protein
VVSVVGAWLLAFLPAKINLVFSGDQLCKCGVKTQHFWDLLYLRRLHCIQLLYKLQILLNKSQVNVKTPKYLNEGRVKWLEIYRIWRNGLWILSTLSFWNSDFVHDNLQFTFINREPSIICMNSQRWYQCLP